MPASRTRTPRARSSSRVRPRPSTRSPVSRAQARVAGASGASAHHQCAIIAAMVVFTSFVAFIIPKFIAIWTIPLLAQTISTGAVGTDLADPLLRLLNVSVPFSLFTSFDYLGFWLYAVFGLLVAGPLYGENASAKIAAVTIGLFGLVYHGLLAALLLGAITPPDIESSFLGASGLLLIVVVAMIVSFRRGMVAPSIATSNDSL